MPTLSLDIVKSKPGLYIVLGPAYMFFMEVDAQGVCHQLKPETLVRDGTLGDDGWYLANLRAIHGPYPLEERDHGPDERV